MYLIFHINIFNCRNPLKAVEEAKIKPGACGDTNITKGKDRFLAHGRSQKLGYCEVCQTNFYELLQHINSEIHKEKVAVEDTWKDLDECMSMTNTYNQGTNEELECSV
jgi:hypothetical protein